MKQILYLGGIIVTLIVASCHKEPDPELVGGSQPDGYVLLDDKYYGYKVYGNQTWLTENMVYLPYVVPSNTSSDSIAYYYVYGYEGTSPIAAKATENFKKFGVLYNWTAAKKACPPGWHLPGDAEWTILRDYLGPLAGKMMKSTSGWFNDVNGDNSSGFNALPAGNYTRSEGFSGLGDITYFWSSTDYGPSYAWDWGLTWSHDVIGRFYNLRSYGYSVRCIKDN